MLRFRLRGTATIASVTALFALMAATALASATTAAAGDPSSTWTLCATEGQTCTFTGTKQVRYGANGTFTFRTVTDSIACTNAAFGGDPVPGVVKRCELSLSNTGELNPGDILIADRDPYEASVVRVDPSIVGPTAQTTVSSGSLISPAGVALEADGNILVTDSSHVRRASLFRVDSATGAQTTVSSWDSFITPSGVAVEDDGDILVLDQRDGYGPGAVFRVDPVTGAQTMVSEGGLFRRPTGVAVAANGDILVADPYADDSGYGAVIRVDPVAGAQTKVTKPYWHDQRATPVAIALEADGDIVVAAQSVPGPAPGKLIRIDPATGASTTLAAGVLLRVPIGIAVVPPNRPPVVADDAYSTAEDSPLSVPAPGVLGNDTDPDEQTLRAALVSAPEHGTVTLNTNGAFSYTPATNYNGPDAFTYKANDGHADSNTATVSLTVNAVNDTPTVNVAPGGACRSTDDAGTLNLTLADVDTPATSLTVTATSGNPALVANANITLAGTGASRSITATSASGTTSRTAVLSVRVSDGQATGTVSVTVKTGGKGNDALTGTAGADMLFGQSGNDTLSGLADNDLLCGGRHNDTLTGGAGADHFAGGPGTDNATDLTGADGDTQDGTIP